MSKREQLELIRCHIDIIQHRLDVLTASVRSLDENVKKLLEAHKIVGIGVKFDDSPLPAK